jgi:hypothetical protein
MTAVVSSVKALKSAEHTVIEPLLQSNNFQATNSPPTAKDGVETSRLRSCL